MTAIVHRNGLPTASRQDGSYPRPQLMRSEWADLTGAWAFRSDDADEGRGLGWQSGFESSADIVVPFPPESAASGVGEQGFHPVVWYARRIVGADRAAAGLCAERPVLLLHFGAVDHRAEVWIDGAFVGAHEGGHTPFCFDVTDLVAGEDPLVVVRAEDDPADLAQPRGKQDWHERPHEIWYHRTTGIWQTVWLEAVPRTSVDGLRWGGTGQDGTAATVRFRGGVGRGSQLRIALVDEDAGRLGAVSAEVPEGAAEITVAVPVPAQRNGQAEHELAWSPEHPRLVDASVELIDGDGAVVDAVSSYLGFRTVGVDHGHFLLNRRPYHVRGVLNQAYWPQSHLAAPGPLAHRDEVELIKALGFNACRVHQKIEDPRFLFWADRLGLLVWAEMPSAYEFSSRAVERLTAEWTAVVQRDLSHPSIATWVPFNESWGIQQVADSPAQQAYCRALTDLTRALDPSRPVVSNDGWEHQCSDIVTLHDYTEDGATLARTYAGAADRARLLAGRGPAGRAVFVGAAADEGQPVMLTEFGGVDYQPGQRREDGWGYSSAADVDDWIARITALYDAIRASDLLAGSCYTQLTDTAQETNGLCTADRTPKAPIERIRSAVLG